MDKDESVSIKRQCELLEVCRSSFYYVPRQEGSDNQELMKLIDKQYMETPFYGVLLQMTELSLSPGTSGSAPVYLILLATT